MPRPLEPLDDEALLGAWMSGREAAFSELVSRHGPAVKGYALRMLQSPQQAEEVYVEAMVRLARLASRWERRGTVRAFLFTAAHRLCLDILRQRRVHAAAVPHLVDLAQARPPAPSPEAVALLGERAQALETALARLAPEHREVLLLRVVHGLSAAETGHALGLTPAQVDSQLSYARRQVRSLLAEPARREDPGVRREEA
jgi:RNA polymerase sigma-70 factor (ECF subfamily)